MVLPQRLPHWIVTSCVGRVGDTGWRMVSIKVDRDAFHGVTNGVATVGLLGWEGYWSSDGTHTPDSLGHVFGCEQSGH